MNILLQYWTHSLFYLKVHNLLERTKDDDAYSSRANAQEKNLKIKKQNTNIKTTLPSSSSYGHPTIHCRSFEEGQ